MRGTLEGADTARLWEYGPSGVLEEGDTVVAYFDLPVDLPFTGAWEDADTKDWVADYHRTLQPVTIGRLVVAPTHHTVTLSAGQRPLWLDPGMAFGSGHHETTFLALEALEGLELQNKRVLDVGSGSGILAIAADLLGAADAEGVDNDPDTVPVAQANAKLNGSKARFAVDVLSPDTEPADVLVANLYAELHAELAPLYRAALKPGGVLLTTGILAERGAVARDALIAIFGPLETQTAGEWLLFKATL